MACRYVYHCSYDSLRGDTSPFGLREEAWQWDVPIRPRRAVQIAVVMAAGLEGMEHTWEMC
jgi:hypothetical protein